MEQSEEAAAEAEAKRLRDFRLVLKRRVVESQLLERLAEGVILVRFDRIKPGKDLRLDFLETGQRSLGRAIGQGNRVADLCRLEFLDAGDDEADLPRGERAARL